MELTKRQVAFLRDAASKDDARPILMQLWGVPKLSAVVGCDGFRVHAIRKDVATEFAFRPILIDGRQEFSLVPLEGSFPYLGGVQGSEEIGAMWVNPRLLISSLQHLTKYNDRIRISIRRGAEQVHGERLVLSGRDPDDDAFVVVIMGMHHETDEKTWELPPAEPPEIK